MGSTARFRGREPRGDVSGGTYHVSMTSFRMSVTVLAMMHALFAGFTALVGAFANGGDVWQRLLVVLLHPLGAAGVLVLVLRPRLATTTILALATLLTVNVGCFRHQLLLPRPYLVLTKPLRLDIQCQRAASVKIGWKYLDD